ALIRRITFLRRQMDRTGFREVTLLQIR
ncbi:MAG: hypothetical protein RLZZ131_983, partial [Actinomycetota bacterium]